MTEPMQIGKIEQLTLGKLDLEYISGREFAAREITKALGQRIDSGMPIVTAVENGIEQGRREQFQADCETICWYCANGGYEPAVYDAESDTFVHEKKVTRKTKKESKKEHCDASLLFDAWNETHKGQ